MTTTKSRFKSSFVLLSLFFITLSIVSVVYAVASWTNTGSMIIARADHTATKMSSGKVLIAGCQNFIKSTETYNPSTGGWSYTSGGMHYGRYHHTAHDVSISGGAERVLVIGGIGVNGVTASTELFNPSTGSWSDAASMHQKRAQQGSALLEDGKVLVVDGYPATPSAEIYDPVANTWTIKQQPLTARIGPTATLLDDGTVFIAGGANASGVALSSTEIYDPVNDTFTAGPTMAYARVAHTATMLPNGDVLIAGGYAPTKAEIYDASAGTMSNAADMTYGHYNHTATLITLSDSSQQVLVAGGTSVKHSELYDYTNDTWSTTTDLNNYRNESTATLLNDETVLAAGGYYSGQTKTAEYYTAP